MSSISVPTVLARVNSTPAALAAAPLTAAQANWAYVDGNAFNQNYNPQSQINSSNAQYLGLSWLFPLPTHPTALLSVSGGLGVDTTPLIINGVIYMTTQYGQVFALNAQNGNVLWTDILPLNPNSTQGMHVGALSLHLHQGEETFTNSLFGNTPAYWIAAPDHKVYAIRASDGKYLLNFSIYTGLNMVDGNNPNTVYATLAANILIDEKRGILVSSMLSSSSNNGARCFYRGWNILANPPSPVWTAYCTPPEPGSNMPVDPSWEITQVNGMVGAQIFYPGPAYNNGGSIPASAVVDLKKMSAAQLNTTLYNDWGYIQSAACAATDAGGSPGATGAGWGSPWLLMSNGYAVVNTGNRGPYNGACNPGPDLWQASVMALNDTNGKWIWGFMTSAHDNWDYDCSWWQGLGNETVSGVNTQVVWKTCKNGYLYELNALNGNMIWAWTPPQSILGRCQYCFMLDPTNKTQMNLPFGNPSLADTVIYPSNSAGIESDQAYSPTLNLIYVATHNVPSLSGYVPRNATNYGQGNGQAGRPAPQYARATCGCDNATISAVDASTGQTKWTHFIATQGYRGGLSTSGNIVFATLSSGDILMLNAQTGSAIKDLYIGGPLNVLPAIGATASGTMEVIFPITSGLVTWGTGVPGDIVALTLQNIPAGATAITTTATVSAPAQTTTSVSTVTVAAGGFSDTTVYGLAAVAVIFVIATGFLAMRGRKPAAP